VDAVLVAMTIAELRAVVIPAEIHAVETDVMPGVMTDAVATPRLQLLAAIVLPVVHIFNFQLLHLQDADAKENLAQKTSELRAKLRQRKRPGSLRAFFFLTNYFY